MSKLPILLLALLCSGCGYLAKENNQAALKQDLAAQEAALAETKRKQAQPATPEGMAWEAVGNGALLVDVRTQAEWDAGYLAGALHIPVDEVQARAAEFGPKNRPVVVYCRSGGRAGRAKTTLEKLGYTAVRNGGGYEALKAVQP